MGIIYRRVWGLGLAVVNITSLYISLTKKALTTKPNCKGNCNMYSSCEGKKKKNQIFKLAILCYGARGNFEKFMLAFIGTRNCGRKKQELVVQLLEQYSQKMMAPGTREIKVEVVRSCCAQDMLCRQGQDDPILLIDQIWDDKKREKSKVILLALESG